MLRSIELSNDNILYFVVSQQEDFSFGELLPGDCLREMSVEESDLVLAAAADWEGDGDVITVVPGEGKCGAHVRCLRAHNGKISDVDGVTYWSGGPFQVVYKARTKKDGTPRVRPGDHRILMYTSDGMDLLADHDNVVCSAGRVPAVDGRVERKNYAHVVAILLNVLGGPFLEVCSGGLHMVPVAGLLQWPGRESQDDLLFSAYVHPHNGEPFFIGIMLVE